MFEHAEGECSARVDIRCWEPALPHQLLPMRLIATTTEYYVQDMIAIDVENRHCACSSYHAIVATIPTTTGVSQVYRKPNVIQA